MFDWPQGDRSALMVRASDEVSLMIAQNPATMPPLSKEYLTVDAELKRNAKSVIDKILHLRDSL
jgi:hypothetical protein